MSFNDEPGAKIASTPTPQQAEGRTYPPPPEGYMEGLYELYGKEHVEQWNSAAEDFLRKNSEEIVIDDKGGNEAYKKLVKAMEAKSGGHSGSSFGPALSMIMYKAVKDLDYRIKREGNRTTLTPGF